MIINVISCNFELNGGGDFDLWKAMHDRLAGLAPHVLLRQEVWDGAINGGRLADAADNRLRLRGYLDESSWTSIAFAPEVFTSIRGYSTGDHFPASLRALTLRQAGQGALPIAVACGHMSYASPLLRELQSGEATRTVDRVMSVGERRVRMKLPGLIGLDTNSYPLPGTAGEVPLPKAEEILDKQHLVHRAREVSPGKWEMDTRPDEILRAAGMEDAARYAAITVGRPGALAPTVDPTTTHGPATRTDRIYLSTELLPAVVDVEVVTMRGLSDHHSVVCRLDSDIVTDLLHDLAVQREKQPIFATTLK